jgi:hyperosmotically inducible periplasmic protein
MHYFKTSILSNSLAIIIGLASTPILAASPDEMRDQNGYNREFKLLDTDSNGKLSAAEIKKDELFNDGGFGKADANKSGSLSKDEYATYKSKVQTRETKQAASDSAITSKIKSKYLIEKNFKSFDVSVETKDGIVVLSGFVDNPATKTRAGQIAAAVKGVKSVSNGLIVKP